ncbi:hypothetical protein BC827DRAFT_829597 [Russula dissimulans]|nr:hypothetical protein BC827DRAFT_829597 [Russula dissimulans]
MQPNAGDNRPRAKDVPIAGIFIVLLARPTSRHRPAQPRVPFLFRSITLLDRPACISIFLSYTRFFLFLPSLLHPQYYAPPVDVSSNQRRPSSAPTSADALAPIADGDRRQRQERKFSARVPTHQKTRLWHIKLAAPVMQSPSSSKKPPTYLTMSVRQAPLPQYTLDQLLPSFTFSMLVHSPHPLPTFLSSGKNGGATLCYVATVALIVLLPVRQYVVNIDPCQHIYRTM